VAQLAMAYAFRKGDVRSGYYRDQTFMLALGAMTVREFFSQLYAHADLDAEPAFGGRSMTGHFATWPVPEVILSMRALTDLMVDSVEGKADYKSMAEVKGHLQSLAGVPVTVEKYDTAKGNSYLLLVDSVYY